MLTFPSTTGQFFNMREIKVYDLDMFIIVNTTSIKFVIFSDYRRSLITRHFAEESQSLIHETKDKCSSGNRTLLINCNNFEGLRI